MTLNAGRLKKDQEIKVVLRKGKKITSPLFIIYYLKEAGHTQSLGFKANVIAGLKVSKKATERNLAKRRVRAIIREICRERKISGNFVFILKSAIISKEFKSIREEIVKCLNQLF